MLILYCFPLLSGRIPEQSLWEVCQSLSSACMFFVFWVRECCDYWTFLPGTWWVRGASRVMWRENDKHNWTDRHERENVMMCISERSREKEKQKKNCVENNSKNLCVCLHVRLCVGNSKGALIWAFAYNNIRGWCRTTMIQKQEQKLMKNNNKNLATIIHISVVLGHDKRDKRRWVR